MNPETPALAVAAGCSPAAPASVIPASVAPPSVTPSVSAPASVASVAPTAPPSPLPSSVAQAAISALNKVDQALTDAGVRLRAAIAAMKLLVAP